MIIFASVIWLIEKPGGIVSDEVIAATLGVEMQALCFETIPSAFWWSLTTMTTVGYGDCYPMSLLGKLLSVFAMIGGGIVLALPITVIGSNFAKMVEMYEEDTLEFSTIDDDVS